MYICIYVYIYWVNPLSVGRVPMHVFFWYTSGSVLDVRYILSSPFYCLRRSTGRTTCGGNFRKWRGLRGGTCTHDFSSNCTRNCTRRTICSLLFFLPTQEIYWTYDVRWEFSEVAWASRWDVYLYATDEQIHWFSIVNR